MTQTAPPVRSRSARPPMASSSAEGCVTRGALTTSRLCSTLVRPLKRLGKLGGLAMDVSRRDVLRMAVGAGGGMALAGLAGSGVNLGPVVAQAQELRIKNAKVTPSICPYCSVGCAT